ncbi:hypothetical protein L227DRAFT_154312 [Lentinus tigrinus ALCF2SS1-6]|uniref:Uncharacterized protein n=1 Tax=Lentinus tigrinus ALCF2SS1-6 TaxID=1328759 RepID=A0A5C2S6Z6_9APHY|nr:hypothetical protein L227DRAFT_154312 [Lentinus tigrinus ALCF2SS1-6]
MVTRMGGVMRERRAGGRGHDAWEGWKCQGVGIGRDDRVRAMDPRSVVELGKRRVLGGLRRWREFSVTKKAIARLEACKACESVWCRTQFDHCGLGWAGLSAAAGSCLRTGWQAGWRPWCEAEDTKQAGHRAGATGPGGGRCLSVVRDKPGGGAARGAGSGRGRGRRAPV